MRISPLCAALLCSAAFAAPARAYEDHVTLGVGAGYAYSAARERPHHGALVALSGSAGLGPVWSARARATYALHPGDAPEHAVLFGGDLLYMIDVLEIVPYFGGGASVMGRSYRADFDLETAAHLVVGMGYLISRELTFELEARPYLLLTELSNRPFYGVVGAAVVFMIDP